MAELYRGARVVDPANGRDELIDLRVENGKISAVGYSLPAEGAREVDLTGKTIIPGVVDLHVHLREPGTRGETIATGTESALRGGVTTLVAMPDTQPCIDDLTALRSVRALAAATARVKVLFAAGATRGLAGREVTEIQLLAEAGAVCFGDARPIADAEILRRVALAVARAEAVLVSQPEDCALAGEGVINAGPIALSKGLRGSTALAEAVQVARDVLIAAETGARLHLAPITTASAVEQIRFAFDRGIPVTARTTPHHLTFCDADIPGYDTRFRVTPPLRSAADREALIEALREGLISVIASHHAPQPTDRTQLEFQNAAPGPAGVETLLPATLAALVATGHLSFSKTVACLTCNPARILGIDAGTLSEGAAADFVVLDTSGRAVFRSAESPSSANTPFEGRTFPVKIVGVYIDGDCRHES